MMPQRLRELGTDPHLKQSAAWAVADVLRCRADTRRLRARLFIKFHGLGRRTGDDFEVIEWVHRESTVKSLVIIVVTVSGDLADIKRAYELGANSFVTKNVETTEFGNELRNVREHRL